MNRSVLILIAVAVVLIGVVLLVANPFKDSIHTELAHEGLVASDALTEINSLEFRSAGTTTRLVRATDGWVVASEGDFPADTAAVGTVLRGVRGASVQGIVSTNPDNQGKFQVDSTGVWVTLGATDAPVARFVVGKGGSDFTTSYVRMDGEDAVRVVRGINRNQFTRPQGFRDRTVIARDPEAVHSIRATGPVEWTLTRSDSGWVVGDVAAAAEPVNAVIRSLCALNADGFQDTRPDTLDLGLEPPYGILNMESADGELTLTIGALNASNQRFVTVSEKPGVIYLLGDWRVSGLLKPEAELRESADQPRSP